MLELFSLPEGEGIGGLRPPSWSRRRREASSFGDATASSRGGSPHPPAFRPATSPPGRYLRRDLAGELVLDMGANDIVKACLGPEAEREGALALEPLRPAADDARDGWIALAADAAGDLVAGDPSERRDLLARQRLADDRGEEAGRRLVGPAGPHADRGEAQPHPLEKTAAVVIGEQEF